jgi:hypothetical protein
MSRGQKNGLVFAIMFKIDKTQNEISVKLFKAMKSEKTFDIVPWTVHNIYTRIFREMPSFPEKSAATAAQ